MQLNKVGIGLIAFFGLGGLVVAVAPLFIPMPAEAVLTLVLLGGIWAVVALGLLLYARHQKRRAAHNDWIFQQGLRGTARVLYAGSHATVNEMPLISAVARLAPINVVSRPVTVRCMTKVTSAAKRMKISTSTGMPATDA